MITGTWNDNNEGSAIEFTGSIVCDTSLFTGNVMHDKCARSGRVGSGVSFASHGPSVNIATDGSIAIVDKHDTVTKRQLADA